MEYYIKDDSKVLVNQVHQLQEKESCENIPPTNISSLIFRLI
ncbi:hypothetical protein HanPSC8_Chr09g0365971 [Helianthus annuus]|nr:hypothetical protein HanPSC8_Chr09g0365971 [Helianthus annuus]